MFESLACLSLCLAQVCEHLEEDYAHEETSHCEFAGDIFILGGANEMKWEFTLPYYFDISDAVLRLGQPLDGNYIIQTEVFSVNGTELQAHVLPDPVGAHRPVRGWTDRKLLFFSSPILCRRGNVLVLSSYPVGGKSLKKVIRAYSKEA